MIDYYKKEKKQFNKIIKEIKDKKNNKYLENFTILLQGEYGRGKTTFLKETLGLTDEKRFNRTREYGKEKIIHISPWNRDIKHDFMHYIMQEIKSTKEEKSEFLGRRVFKYVIIFLIIYNIFLLVVKNLPKEFYNFLIEYFNVKIYIEGTLPIIKFFMQVDYILFLVAICILLLWFINNLEILDKIIYEFIVFIKNKNSTYMFDYQLKEIKNQLKKYDKSTFDTVYIVVEDIDRVEKEILDEFLVIWNNLNEIIYDINTNSANPKIIPIIALDKKGKYEEEFTEKMRQYEIILPHISLKQLALENIVMGKELNEKENINKIIDVEACLYKSLYFIKTEEEIKEIKEVLNKINNMTFRQYNRLNSKIHITRNPKDIDYIITEINSLTK